MSKLEDKIREIFTWIEVGFDPPLKIPKKTQPYFNFDYNNMNKKLSQVLSEIKEDFPNIKNKAVLKWFNDWFGGK